MECYFPACPTVKVSRPPSRLNGPFMVDLEGTRQQPDLSAHLSLLPIFFDHQRLANPGP